MEEAEACCQRIGIMSNGSLRCIGSLAHLKKKYGVGFKLYFNTKAENDMAEASAFVESILPKNWKVKDGFKTSKSFQFVATGEEIANLYEIMEELKHKHGIEEW